MELESLGFLVNLFVIVSVFLLSFLVIRRIRRRVPKEMEGGLLGL
jgi:hypothetical protein